ncbi:hypothetical protein Pmani_019259 [Petrolisthes manimaculis]|uniref:Uncharacterized protein n=1 Tax=Petrolisthes manimaculis TaxID=1843537 RepID=A0AAE1PL56_9EUCA|nr:hypothetical protein Pmani_019259 [Petrolisthes manimaculis]
MQSQLEPMLFAVRNEMWCKPVFWLLVIPWLVWGQVGGITIQGVEERGVNTRQTGRGRGMFNPSPLLGPPVPYLQPLNLPKVTGHGFNANTRADLHHASSLSLPLSLPKTITTQPPSSSPSFAPSNQFKSVVWAGVGDVSSNIQLPPDINLPKWTPDNIPVKKKHWNTILQALNAVNKESGASEISPPVTSEVPELTIIQNDWIPTNFTALEILLNESQRVNEIETQQDLTDKNDSEGEQLEYREVYMASEDFNPLEVYLPDHVHIQQQSGNQGSQSHQQVFESSSTTRRQDSQFLSTPDVPKRSQKYIPWPNVGLGTPLGLNTDARELTQVLEDTGKHEVSPVNFSSQDVHDRLDAIINNHASKQSPTSLLQDDKPATSQPIFVYNNRGITPISPYRSWPSLSDTDKVQPQQNGYFKIERIDTGRTNFHLPSPVSPLSSHSQLVSSALKNTESQGMLPILVLQGPHRAESKSYPTKGLRREYTQNVENHENDLLSAEKITQAIKEEFANDYVGEVYNQPWLHAIVQHDLKNWGFPYDEDALKNLPRGYENSPLPPNNIQKATKQSSIRFHTNDKFQADSREVIHPDSEDDRDYTSSSVHGHHLAIIETSDIPKDNPLLLRNVHVIAPKPDHLPPVPLFRPAETKKLEFPPYLINGNLGRGSNLNNKNSPPFLVVPHPTPSSLEDPHDRISNVYPIMVPLRSTTRKEDTNLLPLWDIIGIGNQTRASPKSLAHIPRQVPLPMRHLTPPPLKSTTIGELLPIQFPGFGPPKGEDIMGTTHSERNTRVILTNQLGGIPQVSQQTSPFSVRPPQSRPLQLRPPLATPPQAALIQAKPTQATLIQSRPPQGRPIQQHSPAPTKPTPQQEPHHQTRPQDTIIQQQPQQSQTSPPLPPQQQQPSQPQHKPVPPQPVPRPPRSHTLPPQSQHIQPQPQHRPQQLQQRPSKLQLPQSPQPQPSLTSKPQHTHIQQHHHLSQPQEIPLNSMQPQQSAQLHNRPPQSFQSHQRPQHPPQQQQFQSQQRPQLQSQQKPQLQSQKRPQQPQQTQQQPHLQSQHKPQHAHFQSQQRPQQPQFQSQQRPQQPKFQPEQNPKQPQFQPQQKPQTQQFQSQQRPKQQQFQSQQRPQFQPEQNPKQPQFQPQQTPQTQQFQSQQRPQTQQFQSQQRPQGTQQNTQQPPHFQSSQRPQQTQHTPQQPQQRPQSPELHQLQQRPKQPQLPLDQRPKQPPPQPQLLPLEPQQLPLQTQNILPQNTQFQSFQPLGSNNIRPPRESTNFQTQSFSGSQSQTVLPPITNTVSTSTSTPAPGSGFIPWPNNQPGLRNFRPSTEFRPIFRPSLPNMDFLNPFSFIRNSGKNRQDTDGLFQAFTHDVSNVDNDHSSSQTKTKVYSPPSTHLSPPPKFGVQKLDSAQNIDGPLNNLPDTDSGLEFFRDLTIPVQATMPLFNFRPNLDPIIKTSGNVAGPTQHPNIQPFNSKPDFHNINSGNFGVSQPTPQSHKNDSLLNNGVINTLYQENSNSLVSSSDFTQPNTLHSLREKPNGTFGTVHVSQQIPTIFPPHSESVPTITHTISIKNNDQPTGRGNYEPELIKFTLDDVVYPSKSTNNTLYKIQTFQGHRNIPAANNDKKYSVSFTDDDMQPSPSEEKLSVTKFATEDSPPSTIIMERITFSPMGTTTPLPAITTPPNVLTNSQTMASTLSMTTLHKNPTTQMPTTTRSRPRIQFNLSQSKSKLFPNDEKTLPTLFPLNWRAIKPVDLNDSNILSVSMNMTEKTKGEKYSSSQNIRKITIIEATPMPKAGEVYPTVKHFRTIVSSFPNPLTTPNHKQFTTLSPYTTTIKSTKNKPKTQTNSNPTSPSAISSYIASTRIPSTFTTHPTTHTSTNYPWQEEAVTQKMQTFSPPPRFGTTSRNVPPGLMKKRERPGLLMPGRWNHRTIIKPPTVSPSLESERTERDRIKETRRNPESRFKLRYTTPPKRADHTNEPTPTSVLTTTAFPQVNQMSANNPTVSLPAAIKPTKRPSEDDPSAMLQESKTVLLVKHPGVNNKNTKDDTDKIDEELDRPVTNTTQNTTNENAVSFRLIKPPRIRSIQRLRDFMANRRKSLTTTAPSASTLPPITTSSSPVKQAPTFIPTTIRMPQKPKHLSVNTFRSYRAAQASKRTTKTPITVTESTTTNAPLHFITTSEEPEGISHSPDEDDSQQWRQPIQEILLQDHPERFDIYRWESSRLDTRAQNNKRPDRPDNHEPSDSLPSELNNQNLYPQASRLAIVTALPPQDQHKSLRERAKTHPADSQGFVSVSPQYASVERNARQQVEREESEKGEGQGGHSPPTWSSLLDTYSPHSHLINAFHHHDPQRIH